MADAEETLVLLARKAESAGAIVSDVDPSRRSSVRDTIAAIDAELARHAPSAPATLSDVEG